VSYLLIFSRLRRHQPHTKRGYKMASDERIEQTVGKVTLAMGELTQLLTETQESYTELARLNDNFSRDNARLYDEYETLEVQLGVEKEELNIANSNVVSYKTAVSTERKLHEETKLDLSELEQDSKRQGDCIRTYQKTNEGFVQQIERQKGIVDELHNKVEAFKLQHSHDGLYIDALIKALHEADVDIPVRQK